MTGRREIAILMAIYLFFGFGYSLLMPIWEAPDERSHYGYILSLARTGEPPSIEQNHEARQPSLYYWLAGLPVRLLEAVQPDWVRSFSPGSLPPVEGLPRYDWTSENYVFLPGPLAVRWFGLVCGGLALLCIYAGVRRAFPDEPDLALGSAALAGGIPQFLHITASVNNDVFAILAGGLLFLGLAEICRREDLSRRWLVLAVSALLVPLLIKLTVLPLALTTLAAIAIRTRQVGTPRAARALWITGGLVGLAALLILAASPGTVDRFLAEARYRLLTVRPDVWDDSILRIAGRYLWNFWGKVGWLSVGIPIPAVAVLTALAAAGIGGSLQALPASGSGAEMPPAGRRLLAFSLAAAGVAGLVLLRNVLTSPQLQGRFLFPTLGPVALLAVFGWRRILGDRRRFLAPALVLMFALLNLHLWITGVIPVYYQPFLDR